MSDKYTILIVSLVLVAFLSITQKDASAHHDNTEYTWLYFVDENGNHIEKKLPYAIEVDDSYSEWSVKSRGPYCDIIDQTGKTPQTTIDSLDDNFTRIIWPNDTAAFGTPPYSKIDIIITLSYPADGPGGVAGWFTPSNPDAIYLDYDDLYIDLDVTAHEFQHLIHHSKDSNEVTWVDEGCADTGIYVCYGPYRPGIQNHVASYISNTDNDFTSWDGSTTDYGGACSFIIYLHDHYGGNSFTKSLVANYANGISGINNVLSSYGKTMNDVFKDFAVAMWLNNKSVSQGQYGFSNFQYYAGHTFLEKNYPCSGSSQVGRWGIDYVRFEPLEWNKPSGDLEITFQPGSSGFFAAVVKVGKAGTSTPDTVEIMRISGGSGKVIVNNLGGDYAVACLVITSLGSSGSYSYSAKIIDLTPPTTTITVSPPKPDGLDGWYITQPTIMLSTEPEATTYYHWDSSSDVVYDGAIQAPEGVHTLYYYSVDKAGNKEDVKSKTFKVDLSTPITTFTISPTEPDGKNGWYVTQPTITLSSQEGIITYRWDNEPFKEYTGPIKAPEGIHKLEFHAKDTSGNLEKTQRLTIKFDQTPPVTNATVNPETPTGNNGWYLSSPKIVLSAKDISTTTIYYKWDENGELMNYTSEITALEGKHRLYFCAEDEAGNRGEFEYVEIQVDTKPPTIFVETDPKEPDGNNGWYISVTSVSLSADEENSKIYYKWNKGAYKKYNDELPVPEGVNVLYYYGVDEAGNKGKEKFVYFKVDTVEPTLKIDIFPDDLGKKWYNRKPKVSINVSENATIYYSLDDSEFKKYNREIEIPEGYHKLVLYAIDDAGNECEKIIKEFKVDTSPPTVNIRANVTKLYVGEEVRFNATGYDNIGIEKYFFKFGDGYNSGWIEEDWIVHVYTKPGNYTVTITAIDISGQESVETSLLVQVLPMPEERKDNNNEGASVLSSIPTQYWYGFLGIMLILIAAFVVAKEIKRRRRMKLYAEVEKAEREREERHVVEIWEDDIADLKDFRAGGLPGYGDAISERAYDAEKDITPQEYVEESYDVSTSYDDVRAEKIYAPEMIVTVEPPKEVEVKYGEVVGAEKPIWALHDKKEKEKKVTIKSERTESTITKEMKRRKVKIVKGEKVKRVKKPMTELEKIIASIEAKEKMKRKKMEEDDTKGLTEEIQDILKKLDNL